MKIDNFPPTAYNKAVGFLYPAVKQDVCRRGRRILLAPGPARCARQGDEGWQLSKDSADAATAPGEEKNPGWSLGREEKAELKP